MRITVLSPYHERCLVEGEADLIRRLESALENSWETHLLATDLAWEIQRYEWGKRSVLLETSEVLALIRDCFQRSKLQKSERLLSGKKSPGIIMKHGTPSSGAGMICNVAAVAVAAEPCDNSG